MGSFNNKKTLYSLKGQAPTPVLQTKTVTPTTSSQSVTYDTGYNGLDVVNVEGVTSAIDSNIQAENIKKDVTILGVTGTLDTNRVDIVVTYGGGGVYRNSNITSFKNTYNDVQSVKNAMFWYCNNLEYVDFGSLASIDYQIFQQNSVLTYMIIRNKTGTTALYDTTYISSVTNNLIIYVPRNRINSYKTATNWSTLYNDGKISFSAIEDM